MSVHQALLFISGMVVPTSLFVMGTAVRLLRLQSRLRTGETPKPEHVSVEVRYVGGQRERLSFDPAPDKLAAVSDTIQRIRSEAS